MTQLSLLPVELADEFEADRSRSKDLLWTGIDTQDRRYALKTIEPDNHALPATEWLCYQLCMLCGIPAPDFAIVTRLDGSQAFGSRWEDGADQYRKEETSHADFLLWLDETRDDVSAMFMLDCFLPNEDRHMGNILFRRGPRRRALAFDWSRTRLFEPWPLAPASSTARNLEWLKQSALYSPAAGARVLAKLAAMDHTQVERILSGMPPEWMTASAKTALVAWWRDHRLPRLDSLT